MKILENDAHQTVVVLENIGDRKKLFRICDGYMQFSYGNTETETIQTMASNIRFDLMDKIQHKNPNKAGA